MQIAYQTLRLILDETAMTQEFENTLDISNVKTGCLGINGISLSTALCATVNRPLLFAPSHF